MPLTVALSTTHHEHDGMYGMDEDVVVLSSRPGAPAPTVVATLTQLSFDVVDTGTTFRMRRQRVVDLDRDGADDLCIESVEETGPASSPELFPAHVTPAVEDDVQALLLSCTGVLILETLAEEGCDEARVRADEIRRGS